MKKSLKKIFLMAGIITCSGFMLNANAKTTYTYYNPEANNYKCPQNPFTIKDVGDGSVSGNWINYYNVYYNNVEYGQTYCMSPGLNSPAGEPIGCKRVLSPSKKRGDDNSIQAFDVAMTWAYQKMIESKIFGKKPTNKSRNIGTVAFRWIESAFGKLSHGLASWANYEEDIVPYIFGEGEKNLKSNWNLNDSTTKTAYNIAKEAIEIGKQIESGATTYEKLVKEGTLWSDQWEFEEVENIQKGSQIDLTFRIRATGGNKLAPNIIKWGDFTVECNDGYTCSNKLKLVKSSRHAAVYKVTIDTKNGNETKSAKNNRIYGMRITTAFNDRRSPYAHVMYFHPENIQYYQRMLLIKNYNPYLIIQTEKNVNWDTCKCEVKNGLYTGNYTAEVRDENGKKTTETFPLTDTAKAKEYNCPKKSTCQEPYKCRIVDGKYYNNSGEVVDEATYRSECLHTCETPSSSNGNQYYCSDEDGQGGEVCTEKEYIRDCMCPSLKDSCSSGNQSSCDEYNKKCPSCTPTITMPSTCNNLEAESELTGIISDINEISTECNETVNQVKSCVLDNEDLTGESFEATSELSNNPYCKVWCKEKYTFKVPTAQYSTSGGYFTLKTTINGTRDCYISSADNPTKPIDEYKFNQDIQNISARIINAYNEYTRWSEGTMQPDTPTTETMVCNGSIVNLRVYRYSWNYRVYDTNGNLSTAHENVESGHGSCENPTDGHSLIDEFRNRRDAALNELNAAKRELEDIVNNYNSCTTGWHNNMIFDPVINYTYSEDYIDSLETEDQKMKEISKSNKTVNIYCTGETDDAYNCLSGSITTNEKNEIIPTQLLKDKTYITCDENHCYSDTKSISAAKWIQKTKENMGTYGPSKSISTYLQFGTIKFREPGCDGNDCLWTRLPDGALPIALKQRKGVFDFQLTFENIGQYNRSTETENSLGRLLGSDVSVISEYASLPDSFKCNYTNAEDILEAGYVCHYINNCKDCCYGCEGENCEPDAKCSCRIENGKYYDNENNEVTQEVYKEKCCPGGECLLECCDETGCGPGHCPVSTPKCKKRGGKYYNKAGDEVDEDTFYRECFNCPTCIMDGEATYKFRTVSLNDLFPNSCEKNSDNCRVEGYNWSTSLLKAKVTKEEIEETAEEIYDEAEYSYTLTPSNIHEIKKYNQEVGSYTNTTMPDGSSALSCETVTFNGLSHRVKCISAFLDDGAKKGYFTENKRNTEFKLWTDYVEGCEDGSCLSFKDGIGPSWK